MSEEFNTFFGGKYIDCYYSSPDRSVISAEFLNESDERFAYHIIADMNEAAYIELLKIVDIETIEQNTTVHYENERQVILSLAMKEAEDQGYMLVENVEQLLVNLCFNYNPDTDIEHLFKLKLMCFELDFVNSSTNEDLKIAIRDADTPFSVLELVNQLKA